MKIGVISISGKPFHIGHDMLINIASKECDNVIVFISTSDRKRKGEFPISGDVSFEILKRYIVDNLPKNVDVKSGGIPIRRVYSFIGSERDNGSTDTYVIYTDSDDMQKNFPKQSLEKYFNDFYFDGHVMIEPIQRTETINISGTKMRSWLTSGDQENFINHLPHYMKSYGNEIWDLYRQTPSVKR